LPQERYNATFVREKQVGVVLHSFAKIDEAVAQLIEPSMLARYRANAAALHNRAVFEIPDILQQIFDRTQAAAPLDGQTLVDAR